MVGCGAGTGRQDNSGKSIMLWRPQNTYFTGSSVGCDCPSSCSRPCRFTGCEINFPEHRPNNSASRPVWLVSNTGSTKWPMFPARQKRHSNTVCCTLTQTRWLCVKVAACFKAGLNTAHMVNLLHHGNNTYLAINAVPFKAFSLVILQQFQ